MPTVIGWSKPVILLPATALSGLSAQQLEALLAHELAHVRRNDYVINLLQALIETLLFDHPAVWWLSRRIRIEREHCCDDLAVQVCGDELSYAKALVALEELRGPRMTLAVSAAGGSLLGRIKRLVTRPTTTEDHPVLGVGAIGVVVVMALLIGLRTLPAGLSEITNLESVETAAEAELEPDQQSVVDDKSSIESAPTPLDAAALATKLKAAAASLNAGRMNVEFEKLTDQSWISGKTDEPLVKMSGKVAWVNDGRQWRIDYDGKLPQSGTKSLSPDQWSTGFEGDQLWDWDRDARSFVIGTQHEHAQQFTPANLFWNATNGGVDSVFENLARPDIKVAPEKLNGLDGYRVEYTVQNDAKWRWSAFLCPSRGYLATEIQQFHNEQLAWDCKLSDLFEVQPGVWAPRTIQRGSYLWSKAGQRSIAWQYEFKIKERSRERSSRPSPPAPLR